VEEEKPWLELGTKLHMYLLEPEEFKKNYIYLEFTKPRGKQQQEFCEYVANSNLKDTNDKIVLAYKHAYASKGKSEDKIKEEASKLFVSLTSYIEYLSKTKIFKDVIWEHPNILLNGSKMVLKSIIDRLIIDHNKKVIQLVDLKTSSSLHEFGDSYKKWGYHRQMAFYWAGLDYYFKEMFPDKDINEYTKETYIVAYQTPNNYGKDYPIRCKVFPLEDLDPDFLKRGTDEIEELLSEIKWHMEENKWEHSRSYYNNNGLETTL
jgi:hypothetical protein